MRTILAALLCLCSALAVAQDKKVFKVTLPDGRITYTDLPPIGTIARTKEMPPVPQQAGIQPISPEMANEINARNKARSEEFEQRYQESLKASEKLRIAEKAKEDGVAPLEGERTGIKAKGRSRMNDAYYKRQEKLDEELEKARKEAETANREFRLMQ